MRWGSKARGARHSDRNQHQHPYTLACLYLASLPGPWKWYDFAPPLLKGWPRPALLTLLTSPLAQRNIKPRGRVKARGREAIEKSRLKERQFQYARHTSDVIDKPFEIVKQSPMYIDEQQRFGTKTHVQERDGRVKRLVRSQRIEERKRAGNIQKERVRWQAEDSKYKKKTAFMDHARETGVKSKANQSSVPYNTLNHRFNDGIDGERLRFREDNYRYKAQIRQTNLYANQNKQHYNPITGALKRQPPKPQKPMTPAQLRDLPPWQRR